MNSEIKNKILSLIGKGNDKEAIELLLKEIPSENRDEAILHSAKFHDIQKQIRLGLLDTQNQYLTISQLRYGILETIKAIEGEKSVSVLVAGTGKYELTKEVSLITSDIGKELAYNKIKLVCGGWEGVDYLIADGYSKNFWWPNLTINDFLVQVVPENSTPVFSGILPNGNGIRKVSPTVIFVKQGVMEWLEAIKYSDAVVLIGGEGGTYETYRYSHLMGRPVIPIQSTGGDAARVFNEIISNWDHWQDVFPTISFEEFNDLTSPIKNELDASNLAKSVIEIIKRIV